MAELEVDQTNLPPIQEVAQYFALLEDGALAHNLQEQEIEKFYSSNVQRNQLVQKDIRVAKRLQNEEHQQAQMLHCPAAQQLEEQDSEYALRIQEEIKQAAKDAQKREEEDKEIAKQIQEEEELLVIQRNSYKRKDNRGLGRDRTCLDLREIQQVLQDEELAHRLQEEEEKLLRQASQFRPSSLTPCPEGDFRVAQVAQDEEIAHFMLEQEMKSQMLPQKLEDCGSERECRPVNYAHDVSNREMHSMGLDSEETVSPFNEFSQHHQPPIAATPTVNIAEELDPTFQREEQMQAGQNPSEPCQPQTTPQAWLNGETTFVAPTKRQNDKSGHVKSKQKRGTVKRKPSCKQQ